MAVRELPIADCLLYDPGAEGWAIDGGFDVFDVPAERFIRDEDLFGRAVKTWEYRFSTRLLGTGLLLEEPSIDALKDIKTVCPRPRVVRKNTPTSQYNFYGGTWVNMTPLEPPRTSLLFQQKLQANTVFRAESKYILPANSNIAFSVHRLPSKFDNNETTYPSKVQVVIADAWQVRFSNGQDAGIWQKVGDNWRLVKQLALSAKDAEVMVWVIVRRNSVCFSFDFGQKWHIAREVTPLGVPSGIISVESVSCQFTFGFHQLAFDNCWYETFDLPTLERHRGVPLIDLSQSYRPFGTSLRLRYLPTAGVGNLRYRVEFKVKENFLALLSFNLFVVPELYATLVYWPTVLAAPIGSSVNLNTVAAVTSINVDEDKDIRYRNGSIELFWDPLDNFSGNYGFRLVDVSLGYSMNDSTNDIERRGYFYVLEPEPSANSDWEGAIRLELADLFLRATTTEVDEGWRPLDGMSTVAARNYCMLKMGLPPSRASWYNTGRFLPSGLPTDPRWHPPPGMKVADVFEVLDLYEDTETFVSHDGSWTSRPARYINTLVDYTFDGDGADPDLTIEEAFYRAEHREVKTGVLGYGKDLAGHKFWYSSINYNLERNPASGGFVGWRRMERLDNIQVTTMAEAAFIIERRRVLQQDVPQLLEMKTPGHHKVFRGFRVKVSNIEHVGATSSHEFRVDSIGLQWSPFKSKTRSTFRCRRMV